MNIPTLPTDNLYKFIFFLGVLLLIGSFLLPYNKYEKIMIEQIYLEGEVSKDSILFEQLKTEVNGLTKKQDSISTIRNGYLSKLHKGIMLTKEEIENEDSMYKFLNDNWKILSKRLQEKSLQSIDLNTKRNLIKAESSSIIFNIWLFWITVVIGICLASYGIIKWKKLQKYSDVLFFNDYYKAKKFLIEELGEDNYKKELE
jgi:hypothetical protein